MAPSSYMFNHLNRVSADLRSKLEPGEYKVDFSTDFQKLAKIAKNFGEQITPQFSVEENTFFRDEAFWIGVYKNGDFKTSNCIATVACKRQPLGKETLNEYIERYFARAFKAGSENKFFLEKRQKRFLQNLYGNLVYSGDFRTHPDYRNAGFGEYLANYAKVSSFIRWQDTDHFYIFVRNRDARKGLLNIINLTQQIDHALNWGDHPSQAEPDYWLGSVSSDHFADWLHDYCDRLNRSALSTG